MALSTSFVEKHISDWQINLTSPFYPHRKHWPTRLYHHAPLENAVEILREGCLRSRKDVNNTHPRDVAAPGVIDSATFAHDYVRLYFRPKTPTQYHIEGIRKKNECQYGDETHAPVLIMFSLDAKYILERDDVVFSDKNMQLDRANTGNEEVFFSSIPFGKVFSEGGTGGDRSITEARCAEVMTASPLPLSECLREIFFRSEPERDTLLHALGDHRDGWVDKCFVSDALKLFEKNFTFVQEVSLTPEGLTFAFNERRDRKSLHVKATVSCPQNGLVISFTNEDLAARPTGALRWIVKQPLLPNNYSVKIWLEGHLAYDAEIPLLDIVV
jgi:hypothetical protein